MRRVDRFGPIKNSAHHAIVALDSKRVSEGLNAGQNVFG